jgi:anti-sigma factor RsiW
MTSDAATQISCQEFVELVTDLLEGQLAEARRIEAEIHLGKCPGCENYLEQIRHTIAGLRALARAEDFPQTRAQALAAFRDLRAT